MAGVEVAEYGFTVPGWVEDLDSFCQRVDSEDFPETGRICFIRGRVWADMTMEQPGVHNQVKLWINMVLATIAREENLGIFFADKMRIRNGEAGISVEPDGMFISYKSFHSGRIHLVEGTVAEYREFERSPEMVFEVISDTSESKDRIELHEDYYTAKVDEYWLVDARDKPPVLDIFRRGPHGFTITKHQAGGWVRSRLFGKAFRLVRSDGPDGNPELTLEQRD